MLRWSECTLFVAETQPLFTGGKENGDRVLGEVEKSSFYCFAQEKGLQWANSLKTV